MRALGYILTIFIFSISTSYGQTKYLLFNDYNRKIKEKNIYRYYLTYDTIIEKTDSTLILSKLTDKYVIYKPNDTIIDSINKPTHKYVFKFNKNPDLQIISDYETIDTDGLFNYVKTKTYKIDDNKIKIYCFGHLGYEIDGNYTVYITKEFGLLGGGSTIWGNFDLLDKSNAKNEILDKLITRLGNDKRFYPYIRFRKKNMIIK
jgi:hypothetical protein